MTFFKAGAITGILALMAACGSGEKSSMSQADSLGAQFNKAVASLTGTLGGVKDGPTADKALPKIQSQTGELNRIKSSATQLPPDEQAGFDKVVQSQLGSLQDQVQRVTSIPGVGDKLKPALDAITKVSSPLAGSPSGGTRVR